MKKLLLGLVLLASPVQAVPLGYSEMHCVEAIAAGGSNLVANVRCIYHLIEERLDSDLCPFCRT